MFQQGDFNLTPLFALPVLHGLHPGLARPSRWARRRSWHCFCWASRFWGLAQISERAHLRLLQAGLGGIGFFLVALLANQLAARLAREEMLAKSSQAAARTQAQVNELVIESLSEGVMVVDTHGVVRNANPAAKAMVLGETTPQAVKLLLSARDGLGRPGGPGQRDLSPQ